MQVTKQEQQQEQTAQFGFNFKFDLVERKRDERQSLSLDPFVFMQNRDHWMIGKPADQACFDYVEKFQQDRVKMTHAVLQIMSLSMLGPVGPIVVLLGSYLRRKLRNV